jgi:hypothetical protein
MVANSLSTTATAGPIAEGWPVAELTAAQSTALAEQLIQAAKIAVKMQPSA